MQNKYPFIMKFEVCATIPKDAQIHYAHVIGFKMVLTSPIELKPNDCIWIDVQDGSVQVIERDDIAVWRSGWLN